MTKLDTKALGLACGILWGVSLLIMGVLAIWCPWAYSFVDLVGTFYIGYTASILGACIGGVWGFVDAGICGFLLAWLYNKFAKVKSQ